MRLPALFFSVLWVLLLLFGCATSRAPIRQRDRFPLDPREELSGPFSAAIESGWEALLSGDAAGAEEEFRRARSQAPRLAAQVGLVEAWVLGGKPDRAVQACKDLMKAGEATLPLLVACGEAKAASSSPLEAFELYRQAVSRAPGREGLEARASELKAAARARLVEDAEARAGQKDWKAARSRLERAIELDPENGELRARAGDVERSAGRREEALERYREALGLARKDRALEEKTAELALELSDHALAISLFDELAREDSRFQASAEEARLLFRVANWPAPERKAARSSRITRAEAASLVWWMVPEVREARVSSGVIASDVVSRRDSRAVTRALSLGLLDVDREAHRANPDGALTAGAGSRLLLRLLLFLRPSGPAPPCLGETPAVPRSHAEAARLAAACGLLQEREGGAVSGPEFTRALDRVRALAQGASTGGGGHSP